MVELTEVRARHPERIVEGWDARTRRPLLGDDGRLLIVAADHPARGALGVRDEPMAMASRTELLERLATAVARPGVDGVLGTPDILDDLLLMGALEDRVVIGSMNRGGLQGSTFELDDRFTGYTAGEIEARGLDGGKMLTRICLDDVGTVATLEASAAAVTDLAARRLMAMVEPFLSVRDGRAGHEPPRPGQHHQVDPHRAPASARAAPTPGSSSPSSTSSSGSWPRRPCRPCSSAVTPRATPSDTYAAWGKALDLPAVRGLVVGRALLFPPDGDVAAAVDIAAELVHGPGAMSGDRWVLPARLRRPGRAGRPSSTTRPGVAAHRLADRGARRGPEMERSAGDLGVRRRTPRGAASVRVTGPDGAEHLAELAGRTSVFAGPTDVAYVPAGSALTLTATEAAVADRGVRRSGAPAPAPRRSGTSAATRSRSSCAARASRPARCATSASPRCSRRTPMIACEVVTPAGNWSSYPPHKHDEERPGVETELEEIYYFETQVEGAAAGGAVPAGADPVGYQRVYGTDERPIDVFAEVRTGDVVLVPHGWHGPAMAAPGYDLYYLNVMAGPGPRGPG